MHKPRSWPPSQPPLPRRPSWPSPPTTSRTHQLHTRWNIVRLEAMAWLKLSQVDLGEKESPVVAEKKARVEMVERERRVSAVVTTVKMLGHPLEVVLMTGVWSSRV